MSRCNVEVLRQELISGNPSVVERYDAKFGEQLDEFVAAIADAMDSVGDLLEKWSHQERPALAARYVYSAANNLFVSQYLLIQGCLVPSGNLMRHFVESAAMAFLLSAEQIGVFSRIQEEKKSKGTNFFPVNSAIREVDKNVELLGIDVDAWRSLKMLGELYHNASHPSLYAVAWVDVGSIGPSFNANYVEAYDVEFQRRVGAAKIIPSVAQNVDAVLSTP